MPHHIQVFPICSRLSAFPSNLITPMKKMGIWGWSNNAAGWAFALYATDLGSIRDILYGLQSEQYWVCVRWVCVSSIPNNNKVDMEINHLPSQFQILGLY